MWERIKQFGSQVTKVIDKTGDISAEDIADALELGTAAKQNVSDLMRAENLKMPNGDNQEEINNLGGVNWFNKIGGFKIKRAHLFAEWGYC